jgi:hypothetical protein
VKRGDCGVQIQHVDESSLEQAGYFEVPGEHLYTILHAVKDPIARVLLVGPFAAERHLSYLPWVRWARYLAARRIECLRYDYRGIGESTGGFENMTFHHWLEDVELLAGWLQTRSPGVPLTIHGLEMGAVLASKAFEKGVGDALLLWSPPTNCNQALRAALLPRIQAEQLFKYGSERKPVSDYLRRLEEGELLEVEGYQWSGTLWSDSFKFELPACMADEAAAAQTFQRPVRILKLDKNAAPLIKGSSVGYEVIGKDFSALFADNFEWIATALATHQGGSVESSH